MNSHKIREMLDDLCRTKEAYGIDYAVQLARRKYGWQKDNVGNSLGPREFLEQGGW